jgi:hypothetical protein
MHDSGTITVVKVFANADRRHPCHHLLYWEPLVEVGTVERECQCFKNSTRITAFALLWFQSYRDFALSDGMDAKPYR